MGFNFYKESYSGGIKEISLGKGEKAVTVGGESCYPFYQFEGDMPHKPRIAMEIWDVKPDEWPEAALIPFKDVVTDPAEWAKKCVDEYGADMIVLQLKSTDPNGKNASPEDATAVVKKVLGAIDVPLIVWGTANVEKDEAVLKKISEECQGNNLIIGPVEDKNHKGIGASAMGYGHTIISSSPIDVNLAKQVNILLENLGMPMDKIIVDPTTGGLGYGLEYTYSVMERLGIAALTQGDDKLQFPIINNLGNEVWKCKEAKQTVDEAPTLGDPEKRGILMEAVGAVSYLMAGSNILIMRHPESIRLTKAFIELLADGGATGNVAPIAKQLDDVDIDYAATSPEPDLSIVEEAKKPVPAKKITPAKAEAKPVAASVAAKAAVSDTKPEVETPKADEKAEEKAAAQAQAEAEEKALTDAKARAKAKEEAKAKAEEEAKAKAEEEAKVKAEEEARTKAAATAKREAEEEELRQKRAVERETLAAKRARSAVGEEVSMTPASEQKSKLDKMLDRLNWVHRRVKLY